MMKNKESLSIKIWRYLIIFSLLILVFLWLFQIIFLDKFYENSKLKELNKSIEEIVKIYNANNNLSDELELISFKYNICIDIIGNINYSSNQSRECLKNNLLIAYIDEFIDSDNNSKSFIITNPNLKNKTILMAKKIDNNYLFINTSLVPVDSTVRILQKQFIYVSIVVLIIAILIGYFISKKISLPIEKINDSAKKLANNDFTVSFPESEIKEINDLSNTLNYAKDEINKADLYRKELMANVSHDLKTPLTMIKAYAEMVRDLTYNNKKKREGNLNVIINEADRLNNLVNDILNLSKLENNTIKLNKEDVDIIKLIKDILNKYKYMEMLNDYKFELNYNKDKILVNVDVKRIEQVLYNLINNAIQYSDDKSIIININQGKDVLIEIINHGETINKNEIKYIWDRYYRSNNKHQRNIVGTGLGLSIVRNILELHGFEYGVNSANKKTCFFFKIR